MTVHELYRSFLNSLSLTYSGEEASRITSMIFEHFAGIDRATMIKNPGLVLNDGIINQIKDGLADLKHHKPVQYIIGEAWFYKMKLKVSPAVLIPRPETEELADAVILSMKEKQAKKIIDIGTGSGCIAISIKKNVPVSTVTAIDISLEALKVAKENADIQQANIHFIQADFLDQNTWEPLDTYDIIVSNPPYIPENEKNEMEMNVTAFEPHGALFVDPKKPLIFYEKIADFALDHLKEHGMIFLETHKDLAVAVSCLFKQDHFSVEIKNDLSGNPRMVIVTRYR